MERDKGAQNGDSAFFEAEFVLRDAYRVENPVFVGDRVWRQIVDDPPGDAAGKRPRSPQGRRRRELSRHGSSLFGQQEPARQNGGQLLTAIREDA